MSGLWIASTVLQWIVIAALVAIVLSLLRQLGELSGRVSASDAEVRDWLAPGTTLPPRGVPLVGGGEAVVGGPKPTPTVVVFLYPGCSVCSVLGRSAVELLRSGAEVATLAVMDAADEEAALAYASEHGLGALPMTLRATYPRHYAPAAGSPFAVALSREGVVAMRRGARTLEDLREMLALADSLSPADAVGAQVAAGGRSDG
jgi:hypothetical protein